MICLTAAILNDSINLKPEKNTKYAIILSLLINESAEREN